MDADTELVVEALRVRAGARQRAGATLSAQLASDRAAGKDVRSGALRVVDQMAAASQLTAVADGLESGALVIEPPEVGPMPEALVVLLEQADEGAEPEDPDTVVVDGLEADVLPDHMVDEDSDEELEAVAALIDAETPDA